MEMKLIKVLALVLAMMMIMGALAACGKETPEPDVIPGQNNFQETPEPGDTDKTDDKDNQENTEAVTPMLQIGEDDYWYVSYDNGVTWTSLGVKATGDKGEQGDKGEIGDDGLSAYEIYKKYYPEYTGTEKQWISDFISGKFETEILHTVSFDAGNGTSIPNQIIMDGRKATMPATPVKDGYEFVGWFLGNEEWSFIGYAVTDDITLVAKWREVGTDGLEYYPLADGTYGVVAGITIYLDYIRIPSVYNGKPVTQILPNAFKDMVNLETVIIPDGVTVIGENAFSGCSKLTNLTLPNSIVHFGAQAFSDCKILSGSFTISSNCKYVGNSCFAKCSNIEIVIIPDSLEYIGAYAFSNVASLIWHSEETTTWNRTVTGTFKSYSSATYDASYHSVTGTYELGTAILSSSTAEDRLSGTAEEKWVKVGSRYFSYVYYRDCTWTRVIE